MSALAILRELVADTADQRFDQAMDVRPAATSAALERALALIACELERRGFLVSIGVSPPRRRG